MLKQLSVERITKSLLLVLALTLPAEARLETQQHLKTDVMFSNASLKSVLRLLTAQMDVNLILDSSVKDVRVKFEQKNISMREAFDNLLEQEKLASFPLARNIILVFQDTPEVTQRVYDSENWTITGLKEIGRKPEQTNEDLVKMLKESSRKYNLKPYNMKNESLKIVVTKLAKELDFVVIFDESVKDSKLDWVASGTTPINAIETLFSAKKLRARILDDGLVIVFPEASDRYEKPNYWVADLLAAN